jgi:hypothetical protein
MDPKSSLGPPPAPIPLFPQKSLRAGLLVLDGRLAQAVRRTSSVESPARKLQRVPEQRFSGAPGRLRKEHLRGVSPASRVLGYTLVEYRVT